MADGSIIIDTKIDSSGLEKQLNNINEKTGKTLKTLAKVGFGVLTAAIASTTVAVNNFLRDTDRVDKLSQKIGISARAFQELDYALGQSGASIESMQMGMKSFRDAMEKSQKSFKELGVTLKNNDGSLKTQEQLLYESISALQKMEDGTNKMVLAEELFGRSATELMPLLNGQSGSFEELTKQANDLGLVLKDDLVSSGVALGDSIDDLKKAFTGFINQSVAPLIPAINNIVKSITEFLKRGEDIRKTIETIGLVMAGLTAATITYFAVFQGGAILTLITNGLTGMAVAIKGITAAMAGNPIGLIAVVITAVLIPAIILLIKNWDTVYIVVSTTLAKLFNYFNIFGSMLVEVFVVGFNSAKIAALSFAQTILTNVLGAVANLLNVMGKMPFVGDKFKEASNAVKGFSDSLNNNITAAKNESQQIINEAKRKQDAQELLYLQTIDNLTKEQKARLDNLKKLKETNQQEIDIMTSGKEAIKEVLSQEQVEETPLKVNLIAADINYSEIEETPLKVNLIATSVDYSKVEETPLKIDAKAMSGKELDKRNVDNYWQNFRLKAKESFEKVKNEFKKFGEAVKKVAKTIKQVFTGIFNTLSSMSEFSAKEIYDNFKSLINGLLNFFVEEIPLLSNRIDTMVTDIDSFFAKFLEKLPNIVATIENTIKKIANIISTKGGEWIKNLNTIVVALSKVLLENLPILFNSLLKFFNDFINETSKGTNQIIPMFLKFVNDIIKIFFDNLPTIIISLNNMLVGMVKSLVDNKQSIIDGTKNIVDGLVNTVKITLPVIIKTSGEIIQDLIKMILELSPDLIKLFTDLIIGINDTIFENMDLVINTVFDLIDGIIQAVIDNLPAIIKAFVEMIVKLVSSISSSASKFVDAFFLIIGRIATSIITMLPQLVTAFIKLIPMLIVELVKAIPELVKTTFNMGVEMIKGIIEGFKSLFSQLAQAMQDAANPQAALDRKNKENAEKNKEILEKYKKKLSAMTEAELQAEKKAFEEKKKMAESSGYFGIMTREEAKAKEEFFKEAETKIATEKEKKRLEEEIQEYNAKLQEMSIEDLSKEQQKYIKEKEQDKSSLTAFNNAVRDEQIKKIEAIKQTKLNEILSSGEKEKAILSTKKTSGLIDESSYNRSIQSILERRANDLIELGALPTGNRSEDKLLQQTLTLLNEFKKKNTNISAYATGTNYAKGGLSIVGEKGAELVNMPTGSQVFNANDTKKILSGEGFANILNGLKNITSNFFNPQLSMAGGQTITLNNNIQGNITVDGKEIGRIAFKNIDKITKGTYGF